MTTQVRERPAAPVARHRRPGRRAGRRVTVLGPWAAVHGTWTGLILIALGALAAYASRATNLGGLWLFEFVTPVGLPLLTTLLTGMGIGMVARYDIVVPLPDPPRAKVLRGAWLLTATAIGAVACGWLGSLPGHVTGGALARNVCVFALLAVATTMAGWPDVAWLPGVLLLGADLYVASGLEDYPWWATLLDPQSTRGQWLVVGGAFVIVWALYVARRQRTST